MNILAIIPARSGSKGIVGKNLKLVGGRSLIGRTIDAAKGSQYQPRVVVSTDGEDIAAEARRCSAEVVVRPASIAGDVASSELALLHTISVLAEGGYQSELVVFLQCTSPLTIAEDIDGTINCLLATHADSAFAAARFHNFLWRPESDGNWTGVNHDKNRRLMRQQRAPEFVETGAVYVMRTEGFLQAKHRFFGKTVAHEIPVERCWEIDDPRDLLVAQAMVESSTKTASLAPPKALVFDFDGVFTDNAVWISDTGVESVRCDRGDGMGIEKLRMIELPMLILSKERNPVVTARAQKLKLPVLQGVDDKVSALRGWAETMKLALDDVWYVGNDINDLECMRVVGLPVAVADAHVEVKRVARYILSRNGGHGAVRELAELVISILSK